jgi:hypothetical protein
MDPNFISEITFSVMSMKVLVNQLRFYFRNLQVEVYLP